MARVELTELAGRRRGESSGSELPMRVRLAHQALLDLMEMPELRAFLDERGEVARELQAAQRSLYTLRAAVAVSEDPSALAEVPT